MSKEDSLGLGQEVLTFSVGGGEPFSPDLITQEPIEVESKDSDSKSEGGSKGKNIDFHPDIIESSKEKEQAESKTAKEPQKENREDKSSAAYLLAESYKKEGVIEEDVAIPEDISAKGLKKLLYNSAYKEVESTLRQEYEEKFGEEILKTADLLQRGIDPEYIKEISSYKRLASAELGDDEDRNLQIKEAVIKSMYQDKGLKQSKIDKLFEDSLEEDDAESEYEEAKTYFAKKVSSMEKERDAENKRQEREIAEKQESINKEIKSIIKSGDVYGIKTTKEQEEFISYLFDNDVTIKIDGKNYKTTGFQKALGDYNKDIKNQLNFAKLLKDGFDLGSIEQKGKSIAIDELDNLLEGKVSKKVEKESESKAPFSLLGLTELL